MKKGYLWLLMFAVLLSSCSKLAEKNEREQLGLRGNVASVVEMSYGYYLDDNDQESLIPGRSEWAENSYDFNVSFTPEGDVTERTIVDAEGAPILKNLYHFQDNQVQYVEVFTQGNDSTVPNFVSVFTYNAQGKRETLTMYNVDSVMMMYQEYGYDSEGNPYDETIFDENKERIGRNFFKYSKDGKLLETRICGADGEVLERHENDYDSRGALINNKIYDADGTLVEEIKRDVNRRGDITKTKRYGEGHQLEEIRHYTYNKQNDVELIEVELPQENKKMKVEYDYEYDEHGNWESCVESTTEEGSDEVTSFILTRDLTYFE